jgi:hypothetical protein
MSSRLCPILRIPYGQIASWLLVAIGVWLRYQRYAFNRSLWLDEAYLALNIIRRTPAELLGPLDYGQASPFGFLALVDLLATQLGFGELVLRGLPFVAGVLSVPLFFVLSRQLLPEWAAVLALALFAVSDSLGEYSAQFKQYSMDVFITLILVLAALAFLDQPSSRVRALGWAALGTAAVWFSHPAAIILAGTGGGAALLLVTGRLRTNPLWLAAIIAAWLASFAAFYTSSLSSLLENAPLTGYWAWNDAFLPSPFTRTGLEVDASILTRAFEDPGGFAPMSGSILLFSVGFLELLYRRDSKLTLVLPLALTAVLSALRLYPLLGRLILFAVPLMVLIVVQGLLLLVQGIGFSRRLQVAVTLLAAGLLLFGPVLLGFPRGWNPRQKEEVRPLVMHLLRAYQPGDGLYVYHAARPAFLYYSELLNFHPEELVLGTPHGDDSDAYGRDLSLLRERPRLWILFSHVFPSARGGEDQVILAAANEIGVRREAIEEVGAALYLYDLVGVP